MVTKADYVTLDFDLNDFTAAIKRYDSLSVLPDDLSNVLNPGDTPDSIICQYAVENAISSWLKKVVPAKENERLHFSFRIGNVRIDVINAVKPMILDPVNDVSVTVNRTNKNRHAFLFSQVIPGGKGNKPFFETLPAPFTFQNKIGHERMVNVAMALKEHYKSVIFLGFSNLNTFMADAKHIPVGYKFGTGHVAKFETYQKEISQLTPIKQVVYHYENITGDKKIAVEEIASS